jgi:SAM-dependent methyltransferase
MTASITATRLEEEAQAFDSQIDERIANGHIPDLQHVEDCDWFINNPWRRRAYVALDFGEQFTLLRDTITALAPATEGRTRVLEVGCGPGYLALELARAGFAVTGLDLSTRSIAIAEEFAARHPVDHDAGTLRYVVGDVLAPDTLPAASFEAIVFLGALHHFPDQDAVLARVHELLCPGGVVLVHEPVRDRVSRRTTTVSYLIRSLLAASGTFCEPPELPDSTDALRQALAALHATLRYEDQGGEKLQSVNDNEAGYADMVPRLRQQFTERRLEWRYGLFHEIIGGLRFRTERENARVAWLIRELDRDLVACDAIDATEFFFAGTRM